MWWFLVLLGVLIALADLERGGWRGMLSAVLMLGALGIFVYVTTEE